ncbi:MAG: type II toxin-antitoxin system Phd/YefM family antitoxin [Candidatus Dormibacteria bacterium]
MSKSHIVPVSDFKRDFARYASEVERGRRVLVTRHGKPVGEFVPAGGLAGNALPAPKRSGGVLALIGILEEWDSMEADMADVVRTRNRQRPRSIPDLA